MANKVKTVTKAAPKKAAPKKKPVKKVQPKEKPKVEPVKELTPQQKKQREGGRFWLGNQMWKLRSKHGRDILFSSPQKLWESACEYFQHCDDNPLIEIDYKGGFATKVEIPRPRAYTMQGLCLYLDCNTGYFNEFEKTLKEKKDKEAAEKKKIADEKAKKEK
jgi:hypothetical protein